MGSPPGTPSLQLPSRHAEPRFERLVETARRLLEAGDAVLAFFEEGRVWIKAGAGAGSPDEPLESSLYGRLAWEERAIGVSDLTADPRLADTAEATTKAWGALASAPIRGPEGERVGLLAVLHQRPREYDAEALELLTDVAALVEAVLQRDTLARWKHAALALRAARQAGKEGPEWLFEHSLDLMVIASLDRYFTQVSPSWTRTLGWTEEELLGRPYTDFVHPDDLAGTVAEGDRLEVGADTLVFRNRYRCRDGSYRWLHWKAHTSLEHHAVFAVARDITDARLAEEELRSAKEAAEAANAAKSAFLASMSHELRTPLNAILGFAKILLQPEVREIGMVERDYLRRVHASGLHLLSLVNQVLDFNRLESGRFEVRSDPLDVGAVVLEVVRQLEALAHDKGLELRAEVPAQALPIWTDEGHLQQILINLVGNALKFTDRGSVLVRVAVEGGTGRALRIDVKDTGAGIEHDQISRAFEPFVQLDSSMARRRGGTGLGLSIARSLCEALDFGLSVESRPGRGSTFSVELKPGRAARQAP